MTLAKTAKYCVIFISKYYKKKLWTNHERASSQARAFNQREEYILPARFDVNLIYTANLDNSNNITINKIGMLINEDAIIYQSMNSQLNKFRVLMEENGIKSYWTDIQGDNLVKNDCVKIIFEEDKSEPHYDGRGKRKIRMTVCGIAPNMPNTRERMNKIINDSANEVFNKFLEYYS